MNIAITVTVLDEMTGERSVNSHVIAEEQLTEMLDDIVSSYADHYADVPFEERAVVDIRFEFVEV
jgi:hypothetical protein